MKKEGLGLPANSTDQHVLPRWRYGQRFFLALSVLGFVGGCIGFALQSEFGFGFNFFALVSFALTALAVYLAIRIFRNQAAQSEADRSAQEKLLSRIDSSSSKAAKSAHSADVATGKMLQLLDTAKISKTGEHLTAEIRTAVMNAYAAVDPEGVKQILWVDDNIDWIGLERKALEAFGVATVWTPNTSSALELLTGNSFQVVITDMGRKEGPQEGYTLLDAMRKRKDNTPVIVYSSSSLPAHVAKVLAHGGQGATNDPGRLFELVLGQLAR